MKNQVKSAFALSLLAMAVATSADAQDRPRVNLNQPQAQNNSQTPGITYNYAGARYVFQDLDRWNCEQDGLNVYGSMDIQDGFFARASFTDVSGSNNCGSRTFIAGGGYHTRFSDAADMYVTVSFGSMSIDGGGEGDDGDHSGIELAAGLRTFLQPQLEGNVELFHTTITNGSATGISGGLVYWFNERFSGTADVGVSADTTTFGLGARMAF